MSDKNRGGSHEKKKTVKGGKKLLITLAIVLSVILVLLGGVYAIFNHLYSKMNYDTGLSDEELQQAIANYDPVDYLEPEDLENVSADDAGSEGEANVQQATEDEVLTFQDEIMAQIEANGGNTISDSNVWNILLIGTDSRTGELKSRSDAMILVSINKTTRQITMTSFMRDIYTYIPALGWYNRLNVPCSVGGPTMLVDTIEQVFGIQIDNYAMVNFFSFIDIVDAVGGVDVEVLEEEIWYLNTNLDEQNNLLGNSRNTDKLADEDAGVVHLNGNQALAYSRIRKLGGDSGRTARQRTVINALIEKAVTMSATELYDLMQIVMPMVTTDMTQTDCLSLIVNALEYLDYEIHSLRIPYEEDNSYNTIIDGMSVRKMDFEQARATLQEKIYGIPKDTE